MPTKSDSLTITALFILSPLPSSINSANVEMRSGARHTYLYEDTTGLENLAVM